MAHTETMGCLMVYHFGFIGNSTLKFRAPCVHYMIGAPSLALLMAIMVAWVIVSTLSVSLYQTAYQNDWRSYPTQTSLHFCMTVCFIRLQPQLDRLTQFSDEMEQLDLKQVRASNPLFKCMLTKFVALASRTRMKPFETLDQYLPTRAIDAGEL
jgi:hypothetical protein